MLIKLIKLINPIKLLKLRYKENMKRKYSLALAALTLCGSMSAQDIYKVENLSGNDLNGTARYVGMGGAMNVLGADISSMGINPAGTGLYRRSDVAFTGSATIQPNAVSMLDIDKARGSFDQAGFVYAFKTGNSGLKYFNIGFNYQKRRNFKNYIGLTGIALPNGMSQTWELSQMAGTLDLYKDNDRGKTMPIANAAYDSQLLDAQVDETGKVTGYNPINATDYNYRRVQWGGVQQYDFNLSANIDDRIYAGVTFGVYNVNMHSGVYYDETIVPEEGMTPEQVRYNYYFMNQEEQLTGTGFDAKFGVIFRPLEDSPLRLGLSFATPTFYDLTSNAYVYMNSPYAFTDEVKQYHPYAKGDSFHTEGTFNTGDFDYRIRTPWKLNIGLATTFGRNIALDAEYEISRYTGASISYPDYDSYSDWWGTTSSTKDRELNNEIDNWLKPVHTFRVGVEAKLAPSFYGRLGYNYVSSAFKDDAYLNLFTASSSYYNRTNTDYVNLGDINRVTAGLGYRGRNVYFDIAYQYQHQGGTAYAFNYIENGDKTTNRLQGQKVNLNRHNIMMTLGFKF